MAKRKRNHRGSLTPSKKRKSVKQKRTPKEAEEEFWEVRDIRGEKSVGGRTEYLVEWAPDRQGKEYPLDWIKDVDVTEEAISAWEAYKKEFQPELIKTGDGHVQPEYLLRRDSTTQIQIPQKRSARRIIWSSSEVPDEFASPSLTQRGLASVRFLDSSTFEIPGIQKRRTRPGPSPRVVISPTRQSQRDKYLELTSSQLTAALESEELECRKSSPPSPRREHKTETAFVVSSRHTKNTIPESQSQKSSQDFGRLLADSSELAPVQFSPTLLEGPKRAVAPRTGIINNRNQTPSSPYFVSARPPPSPNSSTSESHIFDEIRSTRAESASTGIASDGEILSQSQPLTTSNSAPSAQQDIIPSLERDELVSQQFESEVPQEFQPGPSTRRYPDLSQVAGSPRFSADNRHSPAAISKVSHSPTQKSGSGFPNRLLSPLHVSGRSSRKGESMVGASRESTPRSLRASSSVSQVSGQSLGERLRNIRAPTKALADARHAQATGVSFLPQGLDLKTENDNVKEVSVKNGMEESPDILQSTEQGSDQSAEATQAESVGTSTDSSQSQAAIPGITTEQPPPKMTILSPRENNQMVPQLDIAEYVVPLPVEGKTLSQYLEIIKSKEVELTKFLSPDRKPSNLLLESVSSLMHQLILTTCHTDYVVPGQLTQASATPSQEVIWADYTSSKFAFLGQVLDVLHHEDIKLLIISESARVTRGLDIYCTGKRIAHTVYGAAEPSPNDDSEVEGSLKVLISSTESGLPTVSDLIIVFDTLADSRLRLHSRPQTSKGKICPIIHLAVKNSPEHALLCCSKDLEPQQLLKSVAKNVFASRRLLGKVDLGTGDDLSQYHDYNQRQQAIKKDFNTKVMMMAKAVAHCTSEDDFETAWPLPVVAFDSVPLEILPAPVVSSSPIVSRTGTPLGQKRLLDILEGGAINKRQRLTPSRDITHMTDSISDTPYQIDILKDEVRKAQQALAKERAERETESNELKTSLSICQKELQEKTIELRAVQHRYETRTKEVHTMRRSIKKHDDEVAAEAARREKLHTDNQSLKEERRNLQEQLIAARSAVKEGGGTAADVEVAREQARELQRENASLLKSNENLKKDFEFVRGQYQNASAAAAESVAQIRDLEEQVSRLEVAASDEKRKLKEVNFKNDRERYLNHITQNEVKIQILEKTIQRKEDELKAAKRGRGVQTRASSVQPGSPRLGGVGAGSRGSSPVPGVMTVGRMSALRNER